MPDDVPLKIFDELAGQLSFNLASDPVLLRPSPIPRGNFAQDDQSEYVRVPAAELEDGDEIDSRTIVDTGAPE